MRATCSSEIMLHLGKRACPERREGIDPAPSAATDLTDDPASGHFCTRRGAKTRRRSGFGRLTNRRPRQVHIGRSPKGRLICHASFEALAVLALALAMVEAPVAAQTLLIAAVGFRGPPGGGVFSGSGDAIKAVR